MSAGMWDTKQKVERVVAVSTGLGYFSHSHNRGKDGPPPLVTGNVTSPLLAFHVATAQELLKPVVAGYTETRKPLIEECKLPPDPGEIVPTGQEKIDWGRLTDMMKPVLEKEVEIPALKCLTWKMLEAAKVELDPVVIVMLGDYLEGEPTDPSAAKPGI